MQVKTISCGNCNNNFAHSQSVIMHEKNHTRANLFAVIFKNLYIITKFMQVKNIFK